MVTGASGFVGRHLIHRLVTEGAQVTAWTHRSAPVPAVGPVRGVAVDLADSDQVGAALRAAPPQVIFHLAGRVTGDRDPAQAMTMLDANTRSAVAVLGAATDLGGCRVVLAGSLEEPQSPEEPPCSPYAAAKAAATGYARWFHTQHDLEVCVPRLAMIYGPDQPDRHKLVPYVITSLLAGQAPRLGPGTRRADWLYIDDACDALLTAGAHPHAPGVIADVGTGVGTSIGDVVAHLATLIGHPGPLLWNAVPPRSGDADRIADPAAIHHALGWRARTDLADGLRRTVAWYRSHDHHR